MLRRTGGFPFEDWIYLAELEPSAVDVKELSLAQHSLHEIVVGSASFKGTLFSLKGSEERWVFIHGHLCQVRKPVIHVVIHSIHCAS